MAAMKAGKTPSRGRPKGKPRTDAEIAADAKRTGRPLVASDQAESKSVTMRLTPTEYKRFILDAKRLKMGLSEYLRYCWQTKREGRKYGKDIPQSD